MSLATLRLSGVAPRRLRLILLVESALMLGAGCVTGAVAGIYGQVVIDGYLAHVTGFPRRQPRRELQAAGDVRARDRRRARDRGRPRLVRLARLPDPRAE